ncbi:MAG: hypothetical protein IKA70_07630 [Alistipes sp.]|nr:hypothetical protein [Alistipes sp.]
MKTNVLFTDKKTYTAPILDEYRVAVDAGFGNSLGLGDLETEEGELYY